MFTHRTEQMDKGIHVVYNIVSLSKFKQNTFNLPEASFHHLSTPYQTEKDLSVKYFCPKTLYIELFCLNTQWEHS